MICGFADTSPAVGEISEELTGFDVRVIRSARKTISIEIDRKLRVTVRAPNFVSDSDIQRFIDEKSDWVREHAEKMREATAAARAAAEPTMTRSEIEHLASLAMEAIPPRVEMYAKRIGVTYGTVTVRNQTSRWGSCSQTGNLNFNCLLMLAPTEVLDYVIIHELCHRKEMNHSQRFWSEVEAVMPDYKDCKRWLRMYGGNLICRMQGYD